MDDTDDRSAAAADDGAKVQCQKTHKTCKQPSTESYCDKEQNHGGSCHCKECGGSF